MLEEFAQYHQDIFLPFVGENVTFTPNSESAFFTLSRLRSMDRLNESQGNALIHASCARLTLIQGPPVPIIEVNLKFSVVVAVS